MESWKMGWLFKERSVTFWGWTISVVLHCLLLVLLCGIRFYTHSNATHSKHAVSTMTINQIRQMTSYEPIVPKPRIKAKAIKKVQSFIPALTEAQSTENALFDEVVSDSMVYVQHPEPNTESARSEFFGSVTYARKLCYVVDGSGSMKGLFHTVRQQLRQSIQQLEQDQYFYIIIFQDDKLIEFGGKGLRRASRTAKREAVSFINEISPSGSTNAIEAVRRAMTMRDSSGMPAEVIFFLTDGLDLASLNVSDFFKNVQGLYQQNGKQTVINCIGFWTGEDDRVVLQKIADLTGGEFVNVTQ